ncbi:hypothetical protein YC2023_088330 [Brassica napus]
MHLFFNSLLTLKLTQSEVFKTQPCEKHILNKSDRRLIVILGHTTKKMMRSCRFSDTSHVFTLMVICFITLFSSSVHGQGKIRRFKWEVKYELKSPNCFEKLVITINGQFPGPTIKAQQGDTIIVELKNSFMTENVAVHWHGIRQLKKTFDKRTHTLRIPAMLEKSKALKFKPGGLADEGELPEAVNSGLGLLFSSVEPVFSSFRMTKLR